MITAFFYASALWIAIWGALAVWWDKDYGATLVVVVWAVVTVNLIVQRGGI